MSGELVLSRLHAQRDREVQERIATAPLTARRRADATQDAKRAKRC